MTVSPDPEFERLLDYVRETRGFDYTGYKRPSLMRRFRKRMDAVDAATYGDYRDLLDSDAHEFDALFDTILINVTSFFRDAATWDAVRDLVIPKILEQRPTGPIRAWSAGCASGEEPYTIAMLFARALGDEGFRDRVKIYATDIDEDALAHARHAVYTAKQVDPVPDDLREEYFQEASGGRYAFRSDIRRCVIFGRNELLQDPPISRVDLLVSRNTLMYFGAEAQQRVLSNFYFALTRRGFLVVGKAEALQSRTDLFEPFDLKRRVFVKNVGAEFAPVHRLVRVPREREDEAGLDEAAGDSVLRAASFEQAPTAEIVLDHALDVVAINQTARVLFALRPQDVGRPLKDLEVSYRPVELRSLIDRVHDERHAVTAGEVEWTLSGGEQRTLDVHVTPLVTSTGEQVGTSVAFADVTRYRSLQDELQQAQRDLETAYDELQSTVEELETTNEELQSTNEELETTNEELQSTNEELETMNEELQSTNEELETMNDELRERTDEALRTSSFVASILSSIPQGVIVVDRQFQVTAWSRTSQDLWGLREDEVRGEHFLNLDIGLPVGPLREPIRAILSGGTPEPVRVEARNRRGQPVVCVVSFAPLHGYAQTIAGTIVLVAAERAE